MFKSKLLNPYIHAHACRNPFILQPSCSRSNLLISLNPLSRLVSMTHVPTTPYALQASPTPPRRTLLTSREPLSQYSCALNTLSPVNMTHTSKEQFAYQQGALITVLQHEPCALNTLTQYPKPCKHDPYFQGAVCLPAGSPYHSIPA